MPVAERRVGLLLRCAVALLLLLALVVGIGPRRLALAAAQLDVRFAVATACLLQVWVFVGALNVYILLRCLAPVGVGTFLQAYVSGWASGLLLPSQLGDAVQVVVLKRSGVELGVGAAAYLVDKLSSVLVLALVTAVGVRIYLPEGGFWLLVPLVAIPALLLWLLVRRKRGRGRISRLLAPASRYRSHPTALWLNLCLTVFKWGWLAVCYLAAFHAFGAALPLAAAAFIPIMSTLVGYLPVSIAGIGTVEMSAVYLFGRVGVAAPTVLSAYLLLRALQYLLAAGWLVFVRTGEKRT